MISQDNEGPSTQATCKIDWDTRIAGLTKMEALVVEFLSNGKTLREVAQSVGVCDSTMQTYRHKIAAKLLGFMGADILQDIAQIHGSQNPDWKPLRYSNGQYKDIL